MTAFNYMSHGTQDLYATFLEKQRGFDVGKKSFVTMVYAVGAICGGTIVGFLSQRWGRRRCIILCAICGILLIPAWVFAPGTALLIAGGFLMQFMVQGAWGVVPVHLSELSPPLADKALDLLAFSRSRPTARISATSVRRSSAVK